MADIAGNNFRNDRTRNALTWLGHVLGNYVTGDDGLDDIAADLSTATWEGLSDDFGSAIRNLDTALALDTLRRHLTEQVAEQVRAARESGATWEAIGKAFGVSKQAAQQRFGG